jgi:GNAT superfamily N-acetyltransferase
MSNVSIHINERIERAAWSDLFAAAPPETRERLGLQALTIDRSLVLVAPGVDNPLVNRVIGFRPGDELLAVTAPLRHARVPRYFVHVDERDSSVGLQARMHGAHLVRYHRSWVKLLRGPGGRAVAPATDVRVRHALPGDADAVARIFCHAFDLPVSFRPVIAALIGRPGWSVHVAVATVDAVDGDYVLGMGLSYALDGVAYLAGGATSPRHRRRGAQGALVAARVNEALDHGCEWIASETGEAVPGDPQHSFHNMRRAGLVPVSVRHNYTYEGVSWQHGVAP